MLSQISQIECWLVYRLSTYKHLFTSDWNAFNYTDLINMGIIVHVHEWVTNLSCQTHYKVQVEASIHEYNTTCHRSLPAEAQLAVSSSSVARSVPYCSSTVATNIALTSQSLGMLSLEPLWGYGFSLCPALGRADTIRITARYACTYITHLR